MLFCLALINAKATVPYQQIIDLFKHQVDKTVEALNKNYTQYPTFTAKDQQEVFKWRTEFGWCAGFWAGILWQLYDATGDVAYRDDAKGWTASLAHAANSSGLGHDLGFVFYNSFGKGLEVDATLSASEREFYNRTLFIAASTLISRYNPVVGMTRSWGSTTDQQHFQVIIDNLINMELTLWAAQHGGPKDWATKSVSHIDKTAKEWFRPNNSTWHLVVFDPNDGHVQSKSGTPQGLAVNSTWARGQAWGVYGFTMGYRYTGYPRFLDYAKQAASYFLSKLPAGMVPPWDFDCQPPNDQRDTSSAIITASALIELAKHTKETAWVDIAENILTNVVNNYLADKDKSEAVSAYNFHDCADNRCAYVFTDYYLLEAVVRLHKARSAWAQ